MQTVLTEGCRKEESAAAKYRIRNIMSHKVHPAVVQFLWSYIVFYTNKSSPSLLERLACRLFKSRALGCVVYPVTLPYSICSSDFYINLFVHYGCVNATLKNVNVLHSDFCLVLMNIDVVLMGH